MAVIDCPSCNKKVSDKAENCSHCNFPIQGTSDDKLRAFKTEKRIKQQSSLMNQSFIAMLLFCGGFLVLFWQNAQPGTWEYIASITSTVFGFCFYIFTRVRILLLKRQK